MVDGWRADIAGPVVASRTWVTVGGVPAGYNVREFAWVGPLTETPLVDPSDFRFPGLVRMASTVLNTNVLVLNRFYMAIRIVNVRRALTLLYRNCADVITDDDGVYASYDFDSWCDLSRMTSTDKLAGEEYLRAVGFELQVPRIVRLTRFDKVAMQTVRFNRRNLFMRDDYTCQYCGRTEPTQKLSMDHVVPRSHGGPTTWENIVCCCLRCNSRKGGRTPKQANMRLNRTPRKPKVNPLMSRSVDDPRYQSWKTFLPAAC